MVCDQHTKRRSTQWILIIGSSTDLQKFLSCSIFQCKTGKFKIGFIDFHANNIDHECNSCLIAFKYYDNIRSIQNIVNNINLDIHRCLNRSCYFNQCGVKSWWSWTDSYCMLTWLSGKAIRIHWTMELNRAQYGIIVKSNSWFLSIKGHNYSQTPDF